VLKLYPPTVIVTAKYDVLRDENERFYRKLEFLSEKSVDMYYYNTTIHGFFGRSVFSKGPEALKRVVSKMREISVALDENIKYV
jgi:acetyl esterase/lipase